MILLRLSPLIPYNALDFMSGITSISIASYSIALLGVLPGVVLYTFIGATASTLGDHDGDGMTGGGGGGESQNPLVRKVSLVFGILFAALGVSVAAYHANKELKKVREFCVCVFIYIFCYCGVCAFACVALCVCVIYVVFCHEGCNGDATKKKVKIIFVSLCVSSLILHHHPLCYSIHINIYIFHPPNIYIYLLTHTHTHTHKLQILEEEEQQQLEEETRHSLSSSHNEENLPEIT